MFHTVVSGPVFQQGVILGVHSSERDARLFARLRASGPGWSEIAPNYWISTTTFVAVETYTFQPSVFDRPKDSYTIKLHQSCFKGRV